MYEQIFIIAKVFISELNVLQKKPSKQKQCLSFDFWQNYIELYVVKHIILLLVACMHLWFTIFLD